ncbi:MAG: LytTR family DNA-binding domain-containing protein [Saprospiraceae bacterium]
MNVYAPEFIAVKNGKISKLIHLSEISYLKAESNYTVIVHGKCEIWTSKTLKYWEEKISNPVFMRCHHKYLINTSKIVHIDYCNKTMALGDEIFMPIARRKMAIIKKTLFIN